MILNYDTFIDDTSCWVQYIVYLIHFEIYLFVRDSISGYNSWDIYCICMLIILPQCKPSILSTLLVVILLPVHVFRQKDGCRVKSSTLSS